MCIIVGEPTLEQQAKLLIATLDLYQAQKEASDRTRYANVYRSRRYTGIQKICSSPSTEICKSK